MIIAENFNDVISKLFENEINMKMKNYPKNIVKTFFFPKPK